MWGKGKSKPTVGEGTKGLVSDLNTLAKASANLSEAMAISAKRLESGMIDVGQAMDIVHRYVAVMQDLGEKFISKDRLMEVQPAKPEVVKVEAKSDYDERVKDLMAQMVKGGINPKVAGPTAIRQANEEFGKVA